MFLNNEFKQAKVWLLEHNYPLDLIKGIIDFNIVDLANLMFEAEKVYMENKLESYKTKHKILMDKVES